MHRVLRVASKLLNIANMHIVPNPKRSNILTSSRKMAYPLLRMSSCTSSKLIINMAVLVFALLAPSFAHALSIGFQSEIHTGKGTFSIHNISDPGYFIYQVDLVLGQNMQFDTVRDVAGSPDTPGFNDLTNKGIIDDTNLSEDIFTISHYRQEYTTMTGASVGYADSLGTDITDGGRSATLKFADFGAGEAWGFRVDYDKLKSGENPSGSDMLFATLTVYFTNKSGIHESGDFGDYLEYSFSEGRLNGEKKSFPSTLAKSVADPVPEPSTLFLFGAGLIGLAGIVRKKKKA